MTPRPLRLLFVSGAAGARPEAVALRLQTALLRLLGSEHTCGAEQPTP